MQITDWEQSQTHDLVITFASSRVLGARRAASSFPLDVVQPSPRSVERLPPSQHVCPDLHHQFSRKTCHHPNQLEHCWCLAWSHPHTMHCWKRGPNGWTGTSFTRVSGSSPFSVVCFPFLCNSLISINFSIPCKLLLKNRKQLWFSGNCLCELTSAF